MNREQQLESLSSELIEVLKKGNVYLEDVHRNPDVLLTHPDFDKVMDILTAIDCLLEK